MVFPQQNLNNPKILHLFVNDFNTLLFSSSGTITSFYQNCETNCINFLSLYDIQAILPGSRTQLENFINLGRTNYNICGFAGSISLYNPDTQGLNRPNDIINYNNNVSNPSNKLTWMTIENEFWNLETSLNPLKNTSGYLMTTTAGSNIVTSNGINAIAANGNILKVNGEYRQILSVGTNSLTLDRPVTVSVTNTTFEIRDNLVNQTYAIDFETLLYRTKLLRSLCVTNGIKIEIYIAKRVPATQYNRIAPFVDRLLIEEELTSYPVYNQPSSGSRVRQALLGAAANKTGTVTLFGNTLNGINTRFTDDLGLNNSIIINGDEYVINSITNDTQATVINPPTINISTPTTYSNYVHFAPIFYVNPANAQSWMASSPPKSYVDVYRLIAINGYTIGSVTQVGSSPIAYNADTNPIVTGSTYMDGMSIFARTHVQTIQSSVLSSPIPCSSCLTTTPFNIAISGSNPTCDNALNGSITVNFNGNNLTSPYTYTFTSGSTTISIVDSNITYTFGGLASGLWTVTVTDALSTTSNPETITLVETFNPTINTVGNTINFHLTGGTPTYYISSWPFGTFFETGLSDGTHSYTATNGTYSFIIGDSDSCVTDPIPVTVDNTATIVINASSTNPTCTAAANGTITVNINSSATAPFVYTYVRTGGVPLDIDQVSNSTTNTYSNATPGTWAVTVSDSNGNSSNTIILTLTATFAPTVTTASNQATFNLVGGTPPYSIVGNTSPQFNRTGLPSGVNTFNGLPSGSFIFTVTDANGCTTNLPVTIAGGSILSLNISSYVRPNCDATANGIVNLSPGGGLPPYVSYSATNGTTTYTNTTGTFTGLTSDSWTFSLRDSTGTIATNTLTLLDKFNVRYSNTGTTICISASGGSLGNYTVILNGQQLSYNTATTVNCYTGICGTNNITVIDGNLSLSGCVYTATTYVVCPLGISISATPNTCFGLSSNGSVIITASGGTPPYTYQITNVAASPLNNSTGIFTNLPPGIGNWSALITDNNGLTTNGTFSLAKNYSWEVYAAYTGFCITISGGTSPYEITIRGPLEDSSGIFAQYTANTQGTYCFPATAGRYGIQIYDANFCGSEGRYRTYTFGGAVGLNVLDYDNPVCSGGTNGSITVEGIGGQSPYITYSATNGVVTYSNTTGFFGGLNAGTWTLYVVDSNNLTGSTSVSLVNTQFSAITRYIFSANTFCLTIPPTSISPQSYIVTISGTNLTSYNIYDENVGKCYTINTCEQLPINICLDPYNYAILKSFNVNPNPNTPYSTPIIASNGLLYGTTYFGGTFGNGIIYSATTSGNYGVIHNFDVTNGSTPFGSLIQASNGLLYGMTSTGGDNFGGVIYSCDTLGNYGKVYDLPPAASPVSTLIQASNGLFYGVTSFDGAFGSGTIFEYDLNNNIFTVLYEFDGFFFGANPVGPLLQASNNILYGTVPSGGISYGAGLIFSCSTSGDFGILYEFTNNGDGGTPNGALIQASNGLLYGITSNDGLVGNSVLYSYDIATNSYTILNNSDMPNGVSCTLKQASNGLLYGFNTSQNGYGSIFSADTSGNLGVIHYFNQYDGYYPYYGQLAEDNEGYLYGSTTDGGIYGYGSIYRININSETPCCINTSVNGQLGFLPNVYGQYFSGNPYVYVSIDVPNSYPPFYQVTINGQTNLYDISKTTNQYQISGCSNTQVSVCRLIEEYQTVSSFDDDTEFDGSNPQGNLTLVGDIFYGLTRTGGDSVINGGTIFTANTSGSISSVFNFSASTGVTPQGGLTLANDGNLYGTTCFGGDYNNGTLFKFNPTNKQFTKLYDFIGPFANGDRPFSEPIQANDGNLYGTTSLGGAFNFGTIYKYNITTSAYTVLHEFQGPTFGNNGRNPKTKLFQASNGFLYGTTEIGGDVSNNGVIFKFNITANTFTKVHNFVTTPNRPVFNNFLTELDGYLYGMAASSIGGIYKLNLSSETFTVVSSNLLGGSIGSTPYSNLFYDNETKLFYGTAWNGGGGSNQGTVFSFDPLTNYLTKIKSLSTLSGEPIRPYSGLIKHPNGKLYGMGNQGGALSYGGIFSIEHTSGCCYTTTINLSSGFTAPDIDVVWVSGSPQACVSINTSTFVSPPYQIFLQGNQYFYNTSLSANCYTITGCGAVNISIVNYEQDYQYNRIYSFSGTAQGDGASARGSLIQASNGLLYGMTFAGGLNIGGDNGVIYTATTLGNCGVIHRFSGDTYDSPKGPYGKLLETSNGVFYGMTSLGSNLNYGTIFSCNTSGNVGIIHRFDNTNGYLPYGNLIKATNGLLYGMTSQGGLNGGGVIFSCTTSGNYGVIHNFNSATGTNPRGDLLEASNGIFYGMTSVGGQNNVGVIFSCTTSGNYGVIYNFSNATFASSTGAYPYGSLIEASDGLLYGMTTQGGFQNDGVIFRISKTGNFSLLKQDFGLVINDSRRLYGTLTQAPNGLLYGYSYVGGVLGYGTIFSIDLNGNFEKIKDFSGTTYGGDGEYPEYGSLELGNDGNLYGVASSGGAGGGGDKGMIFKLNLLETSGCTYNTTLNVSCDEPLDLNITATVLPCLSNNGSVSVLATGGYPIYTYTLTNGITTFTQTGNTGSVRTFSNLTADTYTATVTDISGNTDSVTLQLSYIDAITTVSGQDLCISVTGSNVTNHLVYVNNILQYTSPAAITFSTCLTGLTGCGVSQVLKIVDSDSGCFYQTSFIIPCIPFNVITATTINPWCYNQPAVVRVSVTGGSQPYDFELIQTSPSISAITPFSVTYGTTPPLYNYATFVVNPPYGTWFGEITDNNGTVITTNNVTLQPRFYVVDPVFSTTGVTLTFSGATPNLSNNGGWTNVSINGTPYNQLTDGTYTYPLPCGVNNTILVQGIDGIKPYAQCLYIFTSYTPCDLGGYNTFVRPECLGDPVSLLAVFITGGTPNYNVSITNGITTYTGVTSDNDIVFQSTGPYPINITGGTWTITTTDSSLDTFIQTITVTPSFNAFVPTISSTGATITISGGTPLYNVTIDGTNYGNTFTNSTYSFPLSPGSHTAVITQPFGDALCPITLSFNIPFDDIVCDYTYSNPTCNNNIGSIAISVTGGTGLYTYTITDGLNTYSSVPPLSAYPNYIFNNLGAGNWQVNVVDSNGSSCNNTITLASNFNVTATGVTSSSSYSSGNICIQINGGTPPYNVYIDNVIRLSATTNLNVCLSASSNANHTYLVVDSNPPCTIYVNDPIFQNSNFDTNTNWLLSYVTGCNNPAVNPIACCTQQYFEINNSNLLYTGLTPASLAFNANGCVQIASARQNFVWPYGARPVASTYAWEIKTGLVSGISPGYAAFQLFVPWLTNSINPVPPYGTGAPPFPGLQSYRTYGGTLYVPSNVYNVNPAVYSGYGINLIISGGYSASTAGQGCKIQISATQLTLISYDISCPCTASGTTFVPGLAGPTISLVGFTNPNCEAASDGVITVSASGGIPAYIYSATNGTTTYTSVNGIFNGLNAGTWYLSLVDSLGATSTLAQPITLYDTFYADVNSYSNGYCVTITGGTQPYIVAIDSNPLNWDYNFDTNCYSANCNTTSVITVRDSS